MVYAIHLIINDNKGIAGCQLQRELSVTYKTARRMLKQIRVAMGNRDMKETFDVFVKIDETYVSGKPSSRVYMGFCENSVLERRLVKINV